MFWLMCWQHMCVLSWFSCVRLFARLLCPWDSPGKNTGMGCHFLLQEIFLTQRSNLYFICLLHWQEDSLPLVLPVPGPGIKPQPPALGAQNLSLPGPPAKFLSQENHQNFKEICDNKMVRNHCLRIHPGHAQELSFDELTTGLIVEHTGEFIRQSPWPSLIRKDIWIYVAR